MENSAVSLGIKVVPHSKSYARALENSTEWKNAIKDGQGYLYVNHIHPSQRFGNVFVLGARQVNSIAVGDFFLASDFELYEEDYVE